MKSTSEDFKTARKGMMLKSLVEKKEREGRITFSISIEKQAKALLDKTAQENGLSSSYLINEIIKRTLG